MERIRKETFSRFMGKQQVNSKLHILVADDNKEMCNLLVFSLQNEGYRVSECLDGNKLLKEISVSYILSGARYNKIDLVISDIRMPGFSGLEVLKNVKYFKSLPPFILITSFGSDEIHEQAKKFNIAAIFNKPFDIDDLLVKVRDILSGKKP